MVRKEEGWGRKMGRSMILHGDLPSAPSVPLSSEWTGRRPPLVGDMPKRRGWAWVAGNMHRSDHVAPTAAGRHPSSFSSPAWIGSVAKTVVRAQ